MKLTIDKDASFRWPVLALAVGCLCLGQLIGDDTLAQDAGISRQSEEKKDPWMSWRSSWSLPVDRVKELLGTRSSYTDLPDLLNSYHDIRSPLDGGGMSRVFDEKKMPELAERLYLLDPTNGLISPDELKPFFRDDNGEAVYREVHSAQQEKIEGLPPDDRPLAVDRYHQGLAEHVVGSLTYRKAFFATFNAKYKHDTNVTQTPDGTTVVSNKRGASAVLGFNGKYDFREGETGAWSLALGGGTTRYFDNSFKNRETENMAITVSDKIEVKKWKLSNVTPKLRVSRDYLRSTGSKEASFDTYTPGATVMFKPLQKKMRHADVLVGVLVADLEYRDYIGADKVNVLSNAEKDTLTPTLTMLGMAMKKYSRHEARSMALLNLRDQQSDDSEQSFSSYRLGLSHTLIWKKWNFTPDLALAGRFRSTSLGLKRNDTTYEAGLALDRQVWKPNIRAQASARHTTQESNIALYSYDNESFTFGLDVQL